MKTQPTGVRIKADKLDFIKEREGLKTVQQVVTFLVDKYWWEQKMNIQDLNKPTNMVEPNRQSTTNYAITVPLPPKQVTQYEAYYDELVNAKSINTIQNIAYHFEADSAVTPQQKKALREFAALKSKDMFND